MDEIPVEIDYEKALKYISSLQELYEPVNYDGINLAGVDIQPPIGQLEALFIEPLVLLRKPTRILEIGTAAGFSAKILGNAAKTYGGEVVSVEINPKTADVARRGLEREGLADTVKIIVGDAKKIIKTLEGRFGMILQDGAKEDYPTMLDELVNMLEPNGILLTDDVMFPIMDLPESYGDLGTPVDKFNNMLRDRKDLKTVWLPIGEGVSFSVKI